MTINETVQEIKSIVNKTIELGLSIVQFYPITDGHRIVCKKGANLAVLLKDISYREKYNHLDQDNNFNIKLPDGALVQFMYSFSANGRELLKHRLAFYPAPDLLNYEDDPNQHEVYFFGESEFHDLLEDNTVSFPLRFDFDSDDDTHIPIQHPYSHLHVGEYSTCRIPVRGPLTPSVFINFILRNFYNTAIREHCNDYSFVSGHRLDATITREEQNHLHFSHT